MSRWMTALMCCALVTPVRADDAVDEPAVEAAEVRAESPEAAESTRRPRVRVSFEERGTLIAPLLAELAALGVDVVQDTVTSTPTPSPAPTSTVARDVDGTIDGWVRISASGPSRFVVEVWFVGTRPEHVATIEADDEAPAAVALRTVELLRAVLVGARAFHRAPPPPPPPAAAPEPRPVDPPREPSTLPSSRADLGLALGGGLGASPGGGIVPLATLGISVRLRAPLEIAIWGGIPLAEDHARVPEGRVDVRVAPIDLSVRFAPRFGRVGLTLGASLGVAITRVVGRTTDEALLGRTHRTPLATLSGVLGGHVSLGETLELIAETRVGRAFSALDVRAGERVVRTWATWVHAMLALRIRLNQ